MHTQHAKIIFFVIFYYFPTVTMIKNKHARGLFVDKGRKLIASELLPWKSVVYFAASHGNLGNGIENIESYFVDMHAEKH
jgi:hypothetical protein